MKNILFKLFAFATLLTMSVSCEQEVPGKKGGVTDPIEYDIHGQFIPTTNQIPADGIVDDTYTCLYSVFVPDQNNLYAYTCTDPYTPNDDDKIIVETKGSDGNGVVKCGNTWFSLEVVPTSNALRKASKIVLNFEPNNTQYERKVDIGWQLGFMTIKKATFIQPPMEQ